MCELLKKDDAAVLDILAGNDKFLKDNFKGLEQFLNVYQPAFAI